MDAGNHLGPHLLANVKRVLYYKEMNMLSE